MREVPKIPERDPLTVGERTFLSRHQAGEFMYCAEDRVMIDACCHRGLLEVADGEFIQTVIDGASGRIRLAPIYRLTQRGDEWLRWTPPADGAAG